MHVFSAVFVFVFIVINLYKIVEFLRNEATAEITVSARLVDKSMRASNDMNANGFASQSITYYL
jgi:regulatory protein YycI of two-component signal transduction system YycFG